MDGKPSRRRFRYSLGGLFLFTAICAGGLGLWNGQRLPFNLDQVELGMTEVEVSAIVDAPHGTGCSQKKTVFDYQLPDSSFFMVVFRNGVVTDIHHVSGR
jgi:hypothetical protein